MEAYPDLLSICSLGLVCLSPRNQTPVVPGKILGYMAAGLPVAAFLHKASDGHAIIEDAGCGITADSANVEACVQVFKELVKTLRTDYDNNKSRTHIIFDIRRIIDQLTTHIKTVDIGIKDIIKH